MTRERSIMVGAIVEFEHEYWMVKKTGISLFGREPYVKLIRYWGDDSTKEERMIRGMHNLKVVLESHWLENTTLRKAARVTR